jgi:hypothetical protein
MSSLAGTKNTRCSKQQASSSLQYSKQNDPISKPRVRIMFPPWISCKLNSPLYIYKKREHSSPPLPLPLIRRRRALGTGTGSGWTKSKPPVGSRVPTLPLLQSVAQIGITPLSVASGCRAPRRRCAPAPRGL